MRRDGDERGDRVRRGTGWRVGLAAVVLAATGAAGPADAGSGTSSAEVPNRRPQTTAVLRTTTADTLVQVNVDIGMSVRAGRRCSSVLPGACKGSVYHPCFNLHDRVYRGCQLYTLFRVLDRTTAAELAQGIEIGSTSRARDGTLVTHNWARKVTQADLEFYAHDPAGRYGDARMRVHGFPHVVGDTAYSDQIGHVQLPRLGAVDAGVVVGRALGRDGRPMPPGSFKLDLFGHSNTGHPTGALKGGAFMLYGFGGAKIQPGTSDGSFRTKPLWTGRYDVHVQRKGSSFRCQIEVTAGQVRLDLHFGRPGLGRLGCLPMRPLAQGVPG